MASNLENLYRQVIMDHYKNPRNKGFENIDGYIKLRLDNPSCGDDVTVAAKIEDDKIIDIKHEGHGCSISCSSTSVMSEALKDKTITEAKAILRNYFDMISGEDFDDEMDMGDGIAYVGIRNFPARIKCATLAWHVLEAIIEQYENSNE